ncbi:MAG: VCBS repeat-containing protein [Planctomycetota bacterium]|nr:VCBS repeat-containing protein [Planctomycetota bacterium]MDA1114588.1 VCBS repeat-containing protein [Planctomycetota bacterium]
MDVLAKRMESSEALIGGWMRDGFLHVFDTAAGNLDFPSALCRERFEDRVRFRGFAALDTTQSGLVNAGSGQRRVWSAADSVAEVDAGEIRIFEELFSEVEWLEHPKNKIHLPVPVWLDRENLREWRITIQLSADAQMKNGQVGHLTAKFDVDWRMQDDSDWSDEVHKQKWKIFAWECRSMEFLQSDLPLFVEVLEEVLPNASDQKRARRSIHEEMVVEFLEKGRKWEKPYLSWRPSAGEVHPTCAVVDYDKDGFDDFYVQERSGRNMMFHNLGNGTFEEVAADLGLDFDGNTASAMFVDLDNDGDVDCFLGGTLERCRVLENTGGTWVDRTGEWIAEEEMPYFVSSLNAVDYDNDGLLDIYCSTYAANFVNFAINSIRGVNNNASSQDAEFHLRKYLAAADFESLHALMTEQAETLEVDTNRPGPPNVLLHNLGGGKFEIAQGADELRILRNSYQSTWADYDNDGDADLYCANDFAPNYLFRNEGSGKFSDVSKELGVVDVGFGMGATWGDYDNDGLQDLYVTNMFSKAARRVTSFFTKGLANYDEALIADGASLDPIYSALGAGNSLFHNEGPATPWDKVSGIARPAIPVEPGGWGWGAQFADFNNDGWLDLYAPAGFYTAPEEAAIDVDV